MHALAMKKNFIKQLREQRNLTLQQLADACNTTHQQISNLENNKRKLTWEWMQRVADALECHPLDLVEGPAEPKDQSERELIKAYRGLADGEKQIFSHMLDGLAKGKNKQEDNDDERKREKK